MSAVEPVPAVYRGRPVLLYLAPDNRLHCLHRHPGVVVPSAPSPSARDGGAEAQEGVREASKATTPSVTRRSSVPAAMPTLPERYTNVASRMYAQFPLPLVQVLWVEHTDRQITLTALREKGRPRSLQLKTWHFQADTTDATLLDALVSEVLARAYPSELSYETVV